MVPLPRGIKFEVAQWPSARSDDLSLLHAAASTPSGRFVTAPGSADGGLVGMASSTSLQALRQLALSPKLPRLPALGVF